MTRTAVLLADAVVAVEILAEALLEGPMVSFH